MSGFKHVVSALERRYDYHSARTMAREAVGNAGLEEKASYEPKELKSIVQKLAALGTGNMQSVWEALEMAPRGVKLATAAPPEEPASGEEEPKSPKGRGKSKKGGGKK